MAIACGTMYPGKMMGNVLRVRNMTDHEQIIELRLDQNTQLYDKGEFEECFKYRDDVSVRSDASCRSRTSRMSIQDNTIENSEFKYQTWFIENPVTKELQKKLYMKLDAYAIQPFTIVVRGPVNATKSQNLACKVAVSVLNQPGERFDQDNTFDYFLETEYDGRIDSFIQDRQSVAENQRQEILLNGKIKIPKIVCTRAMQRQFAKNGQSYASEIQTAQKEKVVPISLSMAEPKKKFKIPFKNMSENDLEVEFYFPKISAATHVGGLDEDQDPSPVRLSVETKVIVVPAGCQAVSLKFSARLSNDYLFQQGKCQSPVNNANESEKTQEQLDRYNHLLIARVVGTNVMFPYIVEASIQK